MIHNTFLLDKKSGNIIASENFWDVSFGQDEILEFLENWRILRETRGVPKGAPVHVEEHKIFHREIGNERLLIFCTDGNDEDRTIQNKIKNAASRVDKALNEHGMDYVKDRFRDLLGDDIFTNFKVCFVGSGGVGKTTLLKLLFGFDSMPTIAEEDRPAVREEREGLDKSADSYRPTSQVDSNRIIEFGTFKITIWDFPGQDFFKPAWKFYLQGADIIFLVTDSSFHNVYTKTKRILRQIQADAPAVPICIIANKQDLPESLDAQRIQALLGIKTFPMEATNKKLRDKFLQFLLDMACKSIGVPLPNFKPKIRRPSSPEDHDDVDVDYKYEDGPSIPKHILALGIEDQERHLIFHIDYEKEISDSIYLRELITALETSGSISKLKHKNDVVIIERSSNFVLALQLTNDNDEARYREILRRHLESMEIRLSFLDGYIPDWDYFENSAYHLMQDIPLTLLSLDHVLKKNKTGLIMQFTGDVSVLSYRMYDAIDGSRTVREIVDSFSDPPKDIYACLQLLIAYGWVSFSDSETIIAQ